MGTSRCRARLGPAAIALLVTACTGTSTTAPPSEGAGVFCDAMFAQASFVQQTYDAFGGGGAIDQAIEPPGETAKALRRAAALLERDGDRDHARRVGALADVLAHAQADRRQLVVAVLTRWSRPADIRAIEQDLRADPGVVGTRVESGAEAERHWNDLVRNAPPRDRHPTSFPGTLRILSTGLHAAERLASSLPPEPTIASAGIFRPMFDGAGFLATVLLLERELCPDGYVTGPTLT